MRGVKQRKAPSAKRGTTGSDATRALTRSRVAFAIDALAKRGATRGARSHKLSVRVDPGLIAAARARLGERSDTELVTAALAVLAGGDEFGAWLVSQAGRLPADFELAF